MVSIDKKIVIPGYLRSEEYKKKRMYARRTIDNRIRRRKRIMEENLSRSGIAHAPMSAKRVEAFLNLLKRTPYNISETCRNAEISQGAVYRMRRFSPEFAEQVENIQNGLLDELEQIQMDAAKEDTAARQWVLARARRERWGDKSTVDVSHEVKEYASTREIPTEVLERFVRERFPQLAHEAEAVLIEGDAAEVAAVADALTEIDATVLGNKAESHDPEYHPVTDSSAAGTHSPMDRPQPEDHPQGSPVRQPLDGLQSRPDDTE